MAFADFPEQKEVALLLQRSLARGRVAHAYLLVGNDTEQLEAMARNLAKALNCQQRLTASPEVLPDSCDGCRSCRNIDLDQHPDVLWVRPESKSRVITIEQMRELMQTVNLKPTEADFKVGVIRDADRLNAAAANAFLKTLEEPPANSVLILLSTEPQRILETILSRCLRLNFSGETAQLAKQPELVQWLRLFAETALAERGSILSRYRLLAVLLKQLTDLKKQIGESFTTRSPLERYDDLDPGLRERWEEELEAAIEAEYRRQRSTFVSGLEWWLRDVWLQFFPESAVELKFPEFQDISAGIAREIDVQDALENVRIVERMQWLLGSNVQEALALEVGLLKLKL